jgi:release factor glutamine methyltransferase
VRRCAGNDEAFTFVDWGTGSGCIAVTLLLEFPRAYGYLVEASAEARSYARINLERYDLTHRAEFTDMIPDCKLLVSNPPYIPSGEIDGLMREVRDYEPHSALDGGIGGLKFYRELLSLAEGLGCEFVVLEIGSMKQQEFLHNASPEFRVSDEVLDGGGFPRCIVLRRNDHEEAGS